MIELHITALEAARADRLAREAQYSRDSLLLAVVVAAPLAAELIDQAISLRGALKKDRAAAI